MNENIKEYIDKYPVEVRELFVQLRDMVYDSVSCDVEEKMWAKIPSYYAADKFVRLIAFKDHINIEATAIEEHKGELSDYKITPKGMLQIYMKQNIPQNILKQVFQETLMG